MTLRKPAVAVMAKVPGMVPVKSRLHAALTPARATDLYRAFLLDRLDAVAALDGVEPMVAFTPPEGSAAMASLAPPALRCLPQRGIDLGARLRNLFDELVLEGRAAIALDSDSPTLPMRYVRQAASTLAAGHADVVLGPCDDGGYYLIGLRAVQPELFTDMPWSTPAVLSATLERAAQRGLTVTLLPEWFDVDTEQDLKRLHAEMRAGGARPARTFAFVQQLFR